MNEIRCGSCRKLLMKSAERAIVGPVEVKCPRCGTLNNLRPLEPFSERPERQIPEKTCPGNSSNKTP
ncbi:MULTISPECIES: Com family DNA-binding transcriptional regulator [unclassified Labrenzia]|uniref:Com family DNA-binding transcriptional regulator n=1 Tax=unclassified Labrenzia TaxID=2648686 RepID=UPI00126805FB